METNFFKSVENKMDFDEAIMLAGIAFFEYHPQTALPSWFNDAVTISGVKNQQKKWVISYSLAPLSQLKKNQHREEIRGNKVVVEFDPATGKKWVLISCEGQEPLIVFEAQIDPVTRLVSVLVNNNLSELDGDRFECCARKMSG